MTFYHNKVTDSSEFEKCSSSPANHLVMTHLCQNNVADLLKRWETVTTNSWQHRKVSAILFRWCQKLKMLFFISLPRSCDIILFWPCFESVRMWKVLPPSHDTNHSEGNGCSSSFVSHLGLAESSLSVCHLVMTESCCDLVLKVSEGEKCSSSSVCHLVVTKTTLKVKGEKCHLVMTESRCDLVTRRWHIWKVFCDSIRRSKLLFFISEPPYCDSPSRLEVVFFASLPTVAGSSESDLIHSSATMWLNEVAHWWRRAHFKLRRKQHGTLLWKHLKVKSGYSDILVHVLQRQPN